MEQAITDIAPELPRQNPVQANSNVPVETLATAAVDAAERDATSVRPFIDASAAKAFFQKSSDIAQRTVSKPLNAIGKIIDDIGSPSKENGPARPPISPNRSTSGSEVPRRRRGYTPSLYSQTSESSTSLASPASPTTPTSQSGASQAGRQASNYNPTYLLPATAPGDYLPEDATPASIQAQIDRGKDGQQRANLETLKQMFPSVRSYNVMQTFVLSELSIHRSRQRSAKWF